jgi:hypothetical protein
MRQMMLPMVIRLWHAKRAGQHPRGGEEAVHTQEQGEWVSRGVGAGPLAGGVAGMGAVTDDHMLVARNKSCSAPKRICKQLRTRKSRGEWRGMV